MADTAAQGGFGVDIFFLISGFCIGVRARHDWEGQAGGGQFLIDRLIRIVPVYYAAFGLMLFWGILFFPLSQSQWFSTSEAPGVFPANPLDLLRILTLTEIFSDRFPLLRVSWTLSAELSYYLLVSIGLSLSRLTRRPELLVAAGFALALATAALPADNPTSFASSAVSGWRHFICGILVSCTLLRPSLKPPLKASAISGIVLLGLVSWHQDPSYWRGWMPAVLAFVLLGLHPIDGWIARQTALRWLQSCGVVSYSLDLIHDPIVSRLCRLSPADPSY